MENLKEEDFYIEGISLTAEEVKICKNKNEFFFSFQI